MLKMLDFFGIEYAFRSDNYEKFNNDITNILIQDASIWTYTFGDVAIEMLRTTTLNVVKIN